MAEKSRIETDKAPPSTGFRSQAMIAGGYLFTGGQIGAPLEPDGGVREPAATLEEQVAVCLGHLEQVTLAGGGSLDRVCEVSSFVVPGVPQDGVVRQIVEFLGHEPPLLQSMAVSDVAMHGMLELDWAVALQPGADLATTAYALKPFMHGGAIERSGPFLCLNRITAEGADMAAQSEGVLDRIEDLLRGEGLELDDLVKLTVFISEFDIYPPFNEATQRRFASIVPPTRSVLVAPEVTGVSLLRVDALALTKDGQGDASQ